MMKRLLTFMFTTAFVVLALSYNQVDAQCAAGETEIILTINTDNWGFETKWEIYENGVLSASGGNPNVIPGANQWNGTNPNIPGSYGNNMVITENICVNSNSTIELVMMDDYGDGNGGYSMDIGGCVWNSNTAAHGFESESTTKQLPVYAEDIAIESLDFSSAVVGNACLSGKIRNTGSGTITSLELKWQINNGPIITQPLTGLSIGCNEVYEFVNGQPAELTNFGANVPISFWVQNPNNVIDQRPEDNNLDVTPVVAKGVVTDDKNVLIEEFSGAWCQFCPDGAATMDQILSDNPGRTVGVTIHNGDAMVFTEGSQIDQDYPQGFPAAMVDRTYFEGEDDVAFSNRSTWAQRTQERLGVNTNMCVSLTTSYNAGTRTVTATVDAKVVDYLPEGDYRVNVFVIEDKVTGTGSGYDQINAYNNDPNHPYYQAGNPIVGFEHNHTLRATMTGTWGDNTVIPASPSADTYTKTYTYTIPNSFDENEIHIVAFLAKHDMADRFNREVLNVIEAGLTGSAVNACNEIQTPDCPKTYVPAGVEELVDEASFEVYPNPTTDKVNIQAFFKQPTEVTIDLYNNIGQRIVTSGWMTSITGTNNFFVDTRQLSEGIYHVVLRTADRELLSEELIVTK